MTTPRVASFGQTWAVHGEMIFNAMRIGISSLWRHPCNPGPCNTKMAIALQILEMKALFFVDRQDQHPRVKILPSDCYWYFDKTLDCVVRLVAVGTLDGYNITTQYSGKESRTGM